MCRACFYNFTLDACSWLGSLNHCLGRVLGFGVNLLSTSPLLDSNDFVSNCLSHPVLFRLRRNVWKRRVAFTARSRI